MDYAWDAVGNRTQFTVAVPLLTGVESYTLDAFSNRLVSTEWDFGATRALTHTDSGNRATDTSTLLGSLAADYDSTDRLVEVRSGNKAVGEYLHNAQGQRVSKTAGKGSGATTHYLYDLAGMLIAEADVPRRGAASVTAEYVWLGGLPLAFVEGGAVYFVHSDHLGTPQVLTDATAAVVWNADYAPFGAAVITDGVTFNLRFPGQYFDAETGAHYNHFRTYDPSLGRYIESDPIGLQGGWNTYGYVGGNPVMRVDPEGLVFGIPGFLESFSFGFSGTPPLLDDELLGISGGVDIIERNCCGEDGREYLETVGSLAGGPSLGASGKLSGSRGQNIMLLSINSPGLPTCINEPTLVPPSFTFNAGSISATFYPNSGQLDIGGGVGAGVSVTQNFAKEWPLGRVEIGECCNK